MASNQPSTRKGGDNNVDSDVSPDVTSANPDGGAPESGATRRTSHPMPSAPESRSDETDRGDETGDEHEILPD